jgi:hypothetical protein
MNDDLVQVPRRLIEELMGYLDRGIEPMVSVPGNGEWTLGMVRKAARRGSGLRYDPQCRVRPAQEGFSRPPPSAGLGDPTSDPATEPAASSATTGSGHRLIVHSMT